MDAQNDPPKSPDPGGSRSTLAGVAVVVVLLGFGLLLFVANFQGAVSGEGVPKGAPMTARGKAKSAKQQKSEKGQKGKVTRVPPDQLVVVGPPFERPPAPPGAKNVVVLVPTSFRRDYTTPYGGTETITPFLGEMAKKGAKFSDLVTAGPFSRYAIWASFTGNLPAWYGVVEPSKEADARALPDSVDTLTEKLRAAGWRTYGVTANFNANSRTGFGQGFDLYRDAQPSGFSPETRLEGPAVGSIAIQMIRNRGKEDQSRPFFLFVDFVDAHPPYRVSKDTEGEFAEDSPNAHFRSAMNRVDGYMRTLHDELAELGYDETNTYFVVVGDHGAGVEDPPHHGKMHGRYFYPSSVSVPWLVTGPGIPAGRVVDGLASSTDVMPTLLGLVGLPVPTEGIDGKSWAAQLQGGDPKTTRTVAISDSWYFEVNRASIWTDRMVCQKDYGTVGAIEKDTFVPGCYDRKVDPTMKEVKADDALMAQLDAWRAEVTPKIAAYVAPPPPPQPTSPGGGPAKAKGKGKMKAKAGPPQGAPTEPEGEEAQ